MIYQSKSSEVGGNILLHFST